MSDQKSKSGFKIMSELKIIGTIKEIGELQTFDSGFVKREFILTTEEQYPQDVKFEAIKEKNIELEAFNKELLEAVRAFESAPKEEPTSTPKSAVEKETAKDRAVRMAQILHANKIIKL